MRFFKSSSDQAYPRLSRLCIAVGLVALGVSAVGSWRFGLSLTEDWFDQHWLAVLYVTGDVAAGVLVAAGATMLTIKGWRIKLGGFLAMLPALVLVSLSVLSTFGVMSGRIATLAGHQKATALDQDRLKWLRGTTINDEIAKKERSGFMKEEKAFYEEARKKALVVHDNQAVAAVNLAAIAGVKLSVEDAQVALTLASSTIPMSVKFICLWCGFFLYGLRKPESDSNLSSSSEGGGGKVKSSEDSKAATVAPKDEKVVAFPAAVKADQPTVSPTPKVSSEAPRVQAPAPKPTRPTGLTVGALALQPKQYSTVEEYLADHPSVSRQRDIADALKVSEAKVSRDIKRLKGRGKVKADRNGRANAITHTPRRTGGLYAIGH